MSKYFKNTTAVIGTNTVNLVIGVLASVIIARILGPEGKGIYTLAILLPVLIVTFTNFGIGPATVYHVAKAKYDDKEILGNNILMCLMLTLISLLCGIIVVIVFGNSIFHSVGKDYLLIALAIIPANFLYVSIQGIFHGKQKFKEYNLANILKTSLFLLIIIITVWGLELGVLGAIIATILADILVVAILLWWAIKLVGGVTFKFNRSYLKDIIAFGLKAHLSQIFIYLNSRADMFIVNLFLNPVFLGYYSIAVALGEKLWMLTNAASNVLFPKIASEDNEGVLKDFTPFVARNVLLITSFGCLAIFFLSDWIIEFLYTEAFIEAVLPLKILLPGIVALSIARVLGTDIAARGRPMLNTYVAMLTIVINIVLNIVWIPMYGISGAALASTVSYNVTLLVRVAIYCKLSGNTWVAVIVPHKRDWFVYRNLFAKLTGKNVDIIQAG